MQEHAEDYLMVAFALTRTGELASTSRVAEHLGVAVSTASVRLKQLAAQGLVEHVQRGSARLTPQGELRALKALRGRRVLELFFVEVLGFAWDDVPAEAGRLADIASDVVIDRIDEFLGRPEADPGEVPIPGSRLAAHEPRYPSLWELGCGAPAVVRRLVDVDAALLRYLAQLQLRPATKVEVLERMPFEGGIRVRVAGVDHMLGARASHAVRVEPLAPDASEGGGPHV